MLYSYFRTLKLFLKLELFSSFKNPSADHTMKEFSAESSDGRSRAHTKGIHVSIFFAKFPTYEIIFRGLRNFRRQARTEKSADAHNKISEANVNISR